MTVCLWQNRLVDLLEICIQKRKDCWTDEKKETVYKRDGDSQSANNFGGTRATDVNWTSTATKTDVFRRALLVGSSAVPVPD